MALEGELLVSGALEREPVQPRDALALDRLTDRIEASETRTGPTSIAIRQTFSLSLTGIKTYKNGPAILMTPGLNSSIRSR